MWRHRHGTLAAAGAAVLSLSAPGARAATIEGSATTFAIGSQEEKGDGTVHTVVPAYEFLTLKADQLHTPWGENLSLVVSGWGSVDVMGSRDRLGPGGDLSIAYVEGGAFDHRLTFRLGRQFVSDGAARMTQVDGATARYLIGKGIGIEGWTGAIVVPRFATPLADAMAGGRLFWHPTFGTEIGASYAQVFNHDSTVRQEIGLDARASITRTILLSGSAFYDPTAGRISEATAEASWRVIRILKISALYQRTAPDLFLPQNSIWTVFAVDEQRDSAGGGITLNPARLWSLYADYLRIIGNNGSGYHASGRVSYSPTYYTLGAEVRALHYAADGHVTPRIFAILRTGSKLTLSADLEESWLEQPMNGQTRVWNASGSAAWAFATSWQFAMGVIGGATPFLSQQVEVLARLEWTPILQLPGGHQ